MNERIAGRIRSYLTIDLIAIGVLHLDLKSSSFCNNCIRESPRQHDVTINISSSTDSNYSNCTLSCSFFYPYKLLFSMQTKALQTSELNSKVKYSFFFGENDNAM